jgi:hypothetical protein
MMVIVLLKDKFGSSEEKNDCKFNRWNNKGKSVKLRHFWSNWKQIHELVNCAESVIIELVYEKWKKDVSHVMTKPT